MYNINGLVVHLNQDQASVWYGKVVDLYFKKKEIQKLSLSQNVRNEQKRNLFQEASWSIWIQNQHDLERFFGGYQDDGYKKFCKFLAVVKADKHKKRLEKVDEPTKILEPIKKEVIVKPTIKVEQLHFF